MLLKLTQGHSFLYFCSKFCAGSKKNVLFPHGISPTLGVLALQDIDNDQIRSVYALLLRVMSSMPRFNAVDGFCLEPPPRTRGPDSVLYQVLAIQNRRSFSIEIIYTDMGQAPMSRARRRGGDNLRSSGVDCQASVAFSFEGVS